MESVIRAIAVYLVLLLLFRISGRRTLSGITTFDFVLLLIISEASQQALMGQDYSVTTAVILVATLVGADVALSYLKQRCPSFDRWIEGGPTVIVESGRLDERAMRRARIDEADVLEAARRLRGLERMDEIKYAILEKSGGITIVPKHLATKSANAPVRPIGGGPPDGR